LKIILKQQYNIKREYGQFAEELIAVLLLI
jgi:hypothetical protein